MLVNLNRSATQFSRPSFQTVTVFAALCAATWSLQVGSQASAQAPTASECGQWEAAAVGAVLSLVKGREDAHLRQAGDAIFRMRRARRNCEAGWIRLACLDYRSIERSGAVKEAEVVVCPPITAAIIAAESGDSTQTPNAAVAVRRSPSNSCAERRDEHPPHDGIIGNEGGDPYGFYVFNRDENLKQANREAEVCAAVNVASAQP